MMAQEALKLLHHRKMAEPPKELEMPFGNQFYFGGGSPYLETQTRRPAPGCEGHEFWGDIVEVPEFRAESTTPRQLIEKAAGLLGVDPKICAIRLGYDLVTELYCHACGHRQEYFYPRRGRRLDLSCRKCQNEARPDYKRALRVMDKFADRPLSDLGFPKLQVFQIYGGKGKVPLELTGDEAEVMRGR